MKKPEELIELLETLKAEIGRPSASYETGARVIVYVGKGQINIVPQDAAYLLNDRDTVNRFFESIGSPDDTGIELYGFEIEDEATSALESLFSTVDSL